jgi:hypothetical protein
MLKLVPLPYREILFKLLKKSIEYGIFFGFLEVSL